MGSSRDFLIRMESEKKENNSQSAASVAKKFSPFSVDSLLATKVKQQTENNNDEDTTNKTTPNHEGKVIERYNGEQSKPPFWPFMK